MNNPINMIKMMMGKMYPKDMAMKMLENNSNPVFANLIDVATCMKFGCCEKKYTKDLRRIMEKIFNHFKRTSEN